MFSHVLREPLMLYAKNMIGGHLSTTPLLLAVLNSSVDVDIIDEILFIRKTTASWWHLLSSLSAWIVKDKPNPWQS